MYQLTLLVQHFSKGIVCLLEHHINLLLLLLLLLLLFLLLLLLLLLLSQPIDAIR